MNNFFTNNNYSRTYSKGKSFKFSVWNAFDTYNNDEFVQDFVQYGQKLWACVSNAPLTNVRPSENDNRWELVVDGVSDVEFKQVESNGQTQILWKYEDADDNSWIPLFTILSVSDREIDEMLKGIEICIPSNPNEYLEGLKDIIISELEPVIGEQVSDMTYGIKDLIESEVDRAQTEEGELNKRIDALVKDAPEDGDTLKELSESIKENKNEIEGLVTEEELKQRLEDVQAGDIRWEDVE